MINSQKAVNTIGIIICLLGIGTLIPGYLEKGFEGINLPALSVFVVLGLGFATGIFTKGNKE
ncbi:hypothetical protein [Kangiella sp. HZ709]|uniref:hypothetical protein n=1 Tax=Kangiella sp. HZ709 TaxID=2666328 RepID=UPI0012B03AE2|nr:hypothetical protein [Kangiella sp. HZ709]MRX26583.1 hypothetical protein [Kangiella sp. HZ709]